jgi:RNA polymerase sigma factor (sigma-70 family)
MSATSGSPSLHDLLGRGAWARRLARHLVRQGGEADDLLQDAWLVAAAKAPSGETPSPGWLSGVLRMLRLQQARAAGRRRQRESESARDAALDAAARPDELLDQVETQRRLAEALLALAEPYRTTVVLRYYEELSAAEIARRSEVPAGTVRWRLKEGLDRLRRHLDEHAVDRRASALALVKFVARGPVTRWPLRLAVGGVAGIALIGVALVAPRLRSGHQGLAVQPDRNEGAREAPGRESDMKKSVGVLAVAAGLAGSVGPGATVAAPGAIPPSKVSRFWVPLGVGPVKGPATAKVTILGFMDYQSTFCLQASRTMDALVAAHRGEVRYQVIHRPLPFHTRAPFATKAALAAGQQGKFWEMHDVLLANQQALEAADIDGYAKKIGLDLTRFKADIAGATVINQADLEQANAQSLKVGAIPSFFLNGRSVPGAQPLAVFEKALAEEIAYADAVLKAGVPPADLYNTITKLGATELPGQARSAPENEQGEPEAPQTAVFRAALKVVNDNEAKVTACYESALALKPALAGRVVVDINLASGRDPQVLLRESTMSFAKVDNCIVKSLKALTYPKAEPGDARLVTVRRAFTFPPERR